jgi:hypothetical protein
VCAEYCRICYCSTIKLLFRNSVERCEVKKQGIRHNFVSSIKLERSASKISLFLVFP